MSALHEVRGVKIRVKTSPPQPRRYPNDVMSQTASVLPNCGINLKQRYDFQEVLKQTSIVRAKRGRSLPKVCQKTPRLRAILLKDHTFHSSNVSSSLPVISSTAPASSNQEVVRKNLPVIEVKSPPPLRRSDAFNSYLTLLRRPTPRASTPLAKKDVHALADSVKLSPLTIENSFAKTVMFYQTHYPLLLEKKFEEDQEMIISRRCGTPIDKVAIIVKRGKHLNSRIVDYDKQLEVLERETEDGVFLTELRNEIFNPTKWPWNLTRYV